jgi:hypothetical protein
MDVLSEAVIEMSSIVDYPKPADLSGRQTLQVHIAQ